MKLIDFDVLHCTRDSIIGDIIHNVTDSDNNPELIRITHTALYIRIKGWEFVIDSQADGTRLRDYRKWLKKYKYSYVVTRSKTFVDEYSMMKKISMYLNAKYGFIDLVRHLIFKWTNVWLGSRRSEKNLTCSEFVMRIFGKPDAYKTNPVEAFKWCIGDGGHKIVAKYNHDA